MSDDKLEALAPSEWFGEETDAQYWACGTGQVNLPERRVGGVRQHVQIKVLVEQGALYGTVNDISLGGALIYASPPLPQGSFVELIFQTERGTARVGGVVRWRLKRSAGSSPNGRIGMGIEFVWMSLQMRSLLGPTYEALPC